MAIQQTPEDRASEDAREAEAEDNEAYRRARAGQLQHEPEQGDDGELIAEVRDAQPQPKSLELGPAQWRGNRSRFHGRAWPAGISARSLRAPRCPCRSASPDRRPRRAC